MSKIESRINKTVKEYEEKIVACEHVLFDLRKKKSEYRRLEDKISFNETLDEMKIINARMQTLTTAKNDIEDLLNWI